MKKLKADNSGMALVMVVVVIGFVSIIATVLLYMSAMNFYMKANDSKIKNGFYSGEKAMEQIRADLILCSETAFANAYSQAMQQYANSDANTTQAIFDKAFAEEMERAWKLKTTGSSSGLYADSTALATYFSGKIDSSFASSISVTGNCSGGFTSAKNTSKGTFTVSRVSLSYTDANGFTTMISTDFVVKSPTISFDMDAGSVEKINLADCVYYSNWVKK